VTAPAATTHHRVEQGALVLLGVMFVPVALQAAFFPRSFFDDFPLGRGWISGTEPLYSEHLVRDVGALFFALVVLSLWAWWEPALCLPLGVVWLIQGTLHLVYHVGHLQHLDGIDKLGMVFSLVTVPAVAIFTVVCATRHRATAGMHEADDIAQRG
jgi:hypothetical protein